MSWVVLGLVIGRLWKGNCSLVGLAAAVVTDVLRLLWELFFVEILGLIVV